MCAVYAKIENTASYAQVGMTMMLACTCYMQKWLFLCITYHTQRVELSICTWTLVLGSVVPARENKKIRHGPHKVFTMTHFMLLPRASEAP
jgi:hypothetical protein